MRSTVFKKTAIMLTVILFTLCSVAVVPVSATSASSKPAKPVISAQVLENGHDVEITISATNGAQGYKIMMKGPEDTKFKKVKTLKKKGTVVRTVVVSDLAEGDYSFKVRAYLKEDGETVWGSYSKIAAVTIKAAEEEKTEEQVEEETEKLSIPLDAKFGDIIVFGSYEQDNVKKNGKEPIEWVVLSNTNEELFVVSKYILDWQPYHTEYVDITWENCSLRRWLNEEFYANAFSEEESKVIKSATVKNEDNIGFGTEGGNDTTDKVFLLSLSDVLNPQYGFDSTLALYWGDNFVEDVNRRVSCTAYAKARGVFVQPGLNKNYMTTEGVTASCWWLRSIGGVATHAAVVNDTGSVEAYGPGVFGKNIKGGDYGVRPALVIDLKVLESME